MAGALCLAGLAQGGSDAQPLTVAVAANFAHPARLLADEFFRREGVEVRVISGSTGKLVAQISKGAPYDLLLAADQAGPQRLVADGHAVADSQQSYYFGRLVVYRAGGGDGSALDQLLQGRFERLAIANPRLAPYGRAAMEALEHQDLLRMASPRLVMGENVAQAYTLAATGNAALALVALSQMRPGTPGDFSPVPAHWHAPIRQDLVMMSRASNPAAARAFVKYLLGEEAQALILAQTELPPAQACCDH